MPSKLLFAGDIKGRFSEFFGKVQGLHQKHNFAFVVTAGNFFADSESEADDADGELSKLLKSEIDIPVTTYFSLGDRPLPQVVVERLEVQDGELCPNLFILGRKTTVKTSEEFKIVALGGKYAPGSDEPMNLYDPTFNDIDAQTAGKDLDQADVLITSDWPLGVQIDGKAGYDGKGKASPKGVQCVADLCTRLKPRYHFSASPAAFERAPFFQPGDSPRHVTRFISLAPFGNAEKQKALYAFTLEPNQPPPDKVPEGCTQSPLFSPRKRKLESQEDSFNSHRWTNGGGQVDTGRGRGGGRGGKRRRNDTWKPLPPDQCFFCLSNVDVRDEKHMIASIQTKAYLTIAKGPLPTRDFFKELGVPCHMLIIPLAHAPTIKTIPVKDDEGNPEQENSLKEMLLYRSALQKFVASKSRRDDDVARLGAVTYEISRAGGVHVQWQFIPVPVEKINDDTVEKGFMVEADNSGWPRFAQTPDEVEKAEQGDFFKVNIWSETYQKEMVLPLDSSFWFDIRFGRRVLAKLLHLDSRVEWQTCKQTKEEEEADRDAFQVLFKEFDPDQ